MGLSNNSSQSNIKIKPFINPNFSNNKKNIINMNNSVYNFPIGNKKSLSVSKFIKLNDYQNMSLLNKYPNIMTISLSQGKKNNNNNAINKINNSNLNNINNISSTLYSFKNNNIIPKKINSLNNNNSLDKNNLNKNNKYNYMSLASNNYLEGYKTFFNKNNSNDKYNYDINTNYFKDEIKKYNSSPIQNYNVIDENDEYPNANDSGINIKSFYNNNKTNKKKNYLNDKKDGKLMTKYKDNKLLGKNFGGKFGMKKISNGYGTLYNYGYGNKKNNVELPQLIQIYNKNNVNKNNINHYYGISYNKKY